MSAGPESVHSPYSISLSILGIAAIGWVAFRALRRSDSPATLLAKWLATAITFAIIFLVAAPLVGAGGMKSFSGLVLALICALVLTVVWRHSIGDIIAKPFASLYDGGDAEIE